MVSADDPRYLRSKQRILTAARELLMAEGPAAVTHLRVAEHSGIGRATVYRHWPRNEEMLAEAMASVPLPFFEVPGVPTRDWLRRELTALARELEQDEVRAVATTLVNAAMWDRDMDRRREQFAGEIAERLAGAIRIAQSAGELSLYGDPESVAARLIGPLYYRSIMERGSVDEVLIDSLIRSLGDWTRRPSHL